MKWITRIELKNDDNENEHTFSSSKADTDNQQPEFILANKSGGFLDYKKLLKVYALDAPEGKPPNFFHFIVYILLGNHKIDDPAGGNTTVQLAEEYDSIKEGLLKNRVGSKKYISAENKIDNFNYSFKNLLIEVEIIVGKTCIVKTNSKSWINEIHLNQVGVWLEAVIKGADKF